MAKKRDIVVSAALDWGEFHNPSHIVANGFAARGHRVFYLNRTLQRWPRPHHLMFRLVGGRKRGQTKSFSSRTENVTPITLWLGPPVRWLRPLNRALIRKGLAKYDIVDPALITFTPTFNTIDIIDYLKPVSVSYDCYHNFDAHKCEGQQAVVADLLVAEKQLVMEADHLFADAKSLQERLERISGGRTVHRALPGVYFDLFRKAYRGDEVQRRKTIYYYGGVGKHINFELYNALAEDFKVVFHATILPAVRKCLSSKIEVRLPAPNRELPHLLKEADINSIFCLDSEWRRGVIPAKLFECFTMGKPLLVSGLKETEFYNDILYQVTEGPDEARRIIANLPETETAERVRQRVEMGRSGDWEKRFRVFYDVMNA